MDLLLGLAIYLKLLDRQAMGSLPGDGWRCGELTSLTGVWLNAASCREARFGVVDSEKYFSHLNICMTTLHPPVYASDFEIYFHCKITKKVEDSAGDVAITCPVFRYVQVDDSDFVFV